MRTDTPERAFPISEKEGACKRFKLNKTCPHPALRATFPRRRGKDRLDSVFRTSSPASEKRGDREGFDAPTTEQSEKE